MQVKLLSRPEISISTRLVHDQFCAVFYVTRSKSTYMKLLYIKRPQRELDNNNETLCVCLFVMSAAILEHIEFGKDADNHDSKSL